MKRLAAVILGCLLTFTLVATAAPKEADQKWLDAVEKMVTNGEKKLSTPSEDRVALVKEWGQKKGYTVTATKTEKGYSIEVTPKTVAKN